MNQRVKREDQIKYIMECRKSGLSDYAWCDQHDIKPGTFYNWVSKLKKSGYTFPDSDTTSPISAKQEVVKLDFASCDPVTSSINIEQNTNHSSLPIQESVAAELIVGSITIRLFNGADSGVIQNTLQCIGGMSNAW